MSWTFSEERPIYWEEPPEQIAITNVETGKRDFYTLTSAVAERIRELRDENTRLRSCLSDTEEHASAFMWEANQFKEERDKLRELVRDIWNIARLCDANKHIEGMRLTEHAREEYMSLMEELGVDI